MLRQDSIFARSAGGGTRRLAMDDKFFTGYRRNAVRPDEVLVSLLLPFSAEDEYFCALKQARRREDDIAIVNLALRLVVDGDRIQDAAIAVGGMAPTTVLAARAKAALIGRYLNANMFFRHLGPSLYVEDGKSLQRGV